MEPAANNPYPNPYYGGLGNVASSSLGSQHIHANLSNGVLSSEHFKSMVDEIGRLFQKAMDEAVKDHEAAQQTVHRLMEPFLKQWAAYSECFKSGLDRTLSGELGKQQLEAQERAKLMFEELLKAFQQTQRTLADLQSNSSPQLALISERINIHKQILKILEIQSTLIGTQDSRDRTQNSQSNPFPIGASAKSKYFKKIDREPIRYFFGRQSVMDDLEKRCFKDPRWTHAAPAVSIAIGGAPGLGKTELALKFALKNLDKVTFFYCLRGGSIKSLDEDYFDIALRLNLQIEQGESSVLVRKRVHNRLEELDPPFLLIYDDLQEKIDLPQRGGIVLIPSCQAPLKDPFNCIELQQLEVEYCYEIIKSYLGIRRPPEKSSIEEAQGLISFCDRTPFLLDAACRGFLARPMVAFKAYCDDILNAKISFLDPPQLDLRYAKDYAANIRSRCAQIDGQSEIGHFAINFLMTLSEAYRSFGSALGWVPMHLPNLNVIWKKLDNKAVDLDTNALTTVLLENALIRETSNRNIMAFSILTARIIGKVYKEDEWLCRKIRPHLNQEFEAYRNYMINQEEDRRVVEFIKKIKSIGSRLLPAALSFLILPGPHTVVAAVAVDVIRQKLIEGESEKEEKEKKQTD